MKELLLYACFQLTTRCNLSCPICYGIKKLKELPLIKVKQIIKKLKEWGFKQIGLTGGEPLLRKDIEEIIRFSKKLKFKVALSTNGMLLSPEKIKRFEKYLDWLSLPLEGHNEEINSKMRSPGFFPMIIKLLTFLNKRKLKVKINTVVTKLNIYHLNEIGEFLNNFLCIKRWKLVQFAPRGEFAKKNRKLFEISTRIFQSQIKKTKLIKI